MKLFIINIISSLAGVVVGALLTCWLTYAFQKKLLRQQLDAQEKSHNEMLNAIKVAGEHGRMHIVSAFNLVDQNLRVST